MATRHIQTIVAPGSARVYEVHWDRDAHGLYVAETRDDAPMLHVGTAYSQTEAVSMAEKAVYDMQSTFDKYVMGTTMGKHEVVAVHLLLEHLLVRALYAVLPQPEALFRNRMVPFSQLVSLCEALGIIGADLGGILRKVNALRNRCAHSLLFKPRDSDLTPLLRSLQQLAPERAPRSDEGHDPWRLLCEVLEDRALELGATDI